MKTENIISIATAMIAALAAIFGVLYNQYASLSLEKQKWQQSIIDDKNKAQREAMVSFAKEFSTSYYLAENMIWRLEMMSDSLSSKDFSDYAKASDQQKSKLATMEILLATMSYSRHSKVAPLLAEYRRIDEQLIVSGLQIDNDRERVLQLLTTEIKRFPSFEGKMVEAFANIDSDDGKNSVNTK